MWDRLSDIATGSAFVCLIYSTKLEITGSTGYISYILSSCLSWWHVVLIYRLGLVIPTPRLYLAFSWVEYTH